MTDTTRPPACHYDRALGMRVTRIHRDDCPANHVDQHGAAGTCPANGRGCAPCTAPHCLICGREHATNATPHTCPECELKVAADLKDIRTAYALLATEALEAGGDGRLVAAAPIPGGNAAVLIGPTVRLDMLRVSRHTRADHAVNRKGYSRDPLPPLAVLAQWEDMYRAWLGHNRPAARATIGRAVAYLLEQLPHLANHADQGPDWVAFTRQVRNLRAECERALHDEREPEVGVECFDCGDRLVRRFRAPTRCKHVTPARVALTERLLGRPAALKRLVWLAQEVVDEHGVTRPRGVPTRDETWAARYPTPVEITAARLPCPACSQGGLDNPDPGRSWECPGCRREYSPGEYATAVRRDLLENGAEGDGWTHVSMAAEAASTLVGLLVPESTVRKWMDRGRVGSCCTWDPQRPSSGLRLVFWPDVADAANEAVARAVAREETRREEERQAARLWDMVLAGARPREAGKQIGIPKARVVKLCEQWFEEGIYDYRRSIDLGHAVAEESA